MVTTTGQRAAWSHPVLALGFRPFYLLGAAFAAAAVPIWVLGYTGVASLLRLDDPLAWHGHEMTFGFAAAILTGFLLTAVKNWSGLPTANGRSLALLAGLWCLGRIGMAVGPAPLAALADLPFLPSVAFAVAVPLIRSGNRRNLTLVAIVLLLSLLNLLFHLGSLGLLDIDLGSVFAAAILLFALLMTVIGSRVIPMFTRNTLPDAALRHRPLVDRLAIAATALVFVLSIIRIWQVDLGLLLVSAATVAAVAQAARLWGWAPLASRRIPLLWVLHAGYAWIPVAFALLVAAEVGLAVPPALPLHAIATGAMGSLMLGMMTRSARGHTARPLVAGPLETAAFVAIQLAALARVAVPLLAPGLTSFAMASAGVFWSLAFLLFVIIYWPILTRPRRDGQPG